MFGKAKVVRNCINHTRQTDTEAGRWHAGLKPAGEPEGIQRGKDVIKQLGNTENLGALQSVNYQNKSCPQKCMKLRVFLQRKPSLCSYLEPHTSDEDDGKIQSLHQNSEHLLQRSTRLNKKSFLVTTSATVRIALDLLAPTICKKWVYQHIGALEKYLQ